jgi:hypothetical protein
MFAARALASALPPCAVSSFAIVTGASHGGDDHAVAVFLDDCMPIIAGQLSDAGVASYRIRHNSSRA